MEQETAKVTIDGVTEEYPVGTSYADIVKNTRRTGRRLSSL